MGLANFLQNVKITDLFKVIAGGTFPRETKEDGLPILRGRDLARNALSRDDVEWFVTPPNVHPEKCAEKGDILVQRIGDRPRSLLVGGELEGCYVGDTLFILRPKTKEVDSGAIAQFLRSKEGQRALQELTRGTTVSTLSKRSFSGLEAPILPAEYSDELEAVRIAEERIWGLVGNLAQKRGELFSAESLVAAERCVTDLITTRLIIETALKYEDDLGYRLGNFYPLPIAFPFRQAEAAHESVRALVEFYRVAEGIVAFLTSVAVALIDQPSNTFKKRLKKAWQGNGATFGTWINLLKSAASCLQNHRNALGRGIFMAVGTGSQLMNDLAFLLDSRNEAIHVKMPAQGKEIDDHLTEIRDCLLRVFTELGFLLRHPMRLVLDVDAIRNSADLCITSLD